VSVKVAHGHARCGPGGPHTWFDVPLLREKAAFDEGEVVVVIPASVYEFLKQTEALVANGVVLDTDEYKRLLALSDAVSQCVIGALSALQQAKVDMDALPRKRCMNCDGNNVNATCTCEGVK
jgi:hypothetical protein